MATTWTWSQIITNIEGISTKTTGSSSQTTANKWGIDTRNGAWLYIPSNGYYTTSHWLNIPWNTLKSKLGNAGTSHVLSGVTFSSENGIKQTGSMTNRGAVTHTFTPSGSEQTYTIQGGYHNGNGKVTCKAVSLTGDADAGHVLSGKTFYKNSLTRQTGTMKNNGNVTWNKSNTEETLSSGYYNSLKVSSKASYTNGYNKGKEDGKNEAQGTSYVGTYAFPTTTNRDDVQVIWCGFRPQIIIGHTMADRHQALVYMDSSTNSAGYSMNKFFMRAGTSNFLEGRIVTTDTGFEVHGNLGYIEGNTYWFVAMRITS